MDEVRIAPAGDPFSVRAEPSTRHFRCNHRFLDILEEDYGISQFNLRSAFMGGIPAPKKQAIELCEWAIEVASGNIDEAGRALRNWARKRGVGTFDPFFMIEDEEETA